jgi:hypothetical protein
MLGGFKELLAQSASNRQNKVETPAAATERERSSTVEITQRSCFDGDSQGLAA